MAVLKQKDVVGEYNMNFICSKAAQYEALTDMSIVYFDREDYEKIIFLRKRNKFQENHDFFTQNFPTFSKLHENKIKKLCSNTKEKCFSKNEHVVLSGCKAD
mmetsp:Transcript_36471/g.41969  ORF Transcript_36471/g.41969 Transcript_36471/m.41969 type:complete len:102 (+) Transcript_36471:118-423(+)